ncbi:MAG: SGNH/GDSL hydrolase family protein [Deltaproteobacteria bacterium]|nr:SGNH/GDSL hydrolase family protein [Deltaproteobacteria bacterium]
MSPLATTRPKLWLLRLGLLATSLLAVLLLFEGGLRLLGYTAIYEVYSKPSLLWQRDDTLGWSHVPNSSEVYVGPRPWPVEFSTEVHINSLGLRGPEIEALPEEGYRILFLGDSVVAAFEVHQQETFVQLIGERLEGELSLPVQTINAGVRGYGTDQSLLYYRERGRKFEPDMVVFIHSINDFRNNTTLHRMGRPFGKPAFGLDAQGELELLGMPIPDYPLCAAWVLDEGFVPLRADRTLGRLFCHFERNLADRSALFTYAVHTLQRHPKLIHRLHELGTKPGRQTLGSVLEGLNPLRVGRARAAPARDPAGQLTAALLIELAQQVEADGATFVLLIRASDLERMGGGKIAAAGIHRYSPVLPPALVQGRRIDFQNDAHYNPLGHEILTRVVTPLLASEIRRQRR